MAGKKHRQLNLSQHCSLTTSTTTLTLQNQSLPISEKVRNTSLHPQLTTRKRQNMHISTLIRLSYVRQTKSHKIFTLRSNIQVTGQAEARDLAFLKQYPKNKSQVGSKITQTSITLSVLPIFLTLSSTVQAGGSQSPELRSTIPPATTTAGKCRGCSSVTVSL